MRLSSPALKPAISIRLAMALCLATVLGACSTASGPGAFTTASLPPRPSEGMLQQPRSQYAAPSAAGAPLPVSANRYQWNGDTERIQTGAVQSPPEAQRAAAPRQIIWQATPRSAPPAQERFNSPTASTSTAGTQPQAAREIVVGPGDTLYGIATRHHVPVASLMQANHLQSPALAVNQRLVLPAASR